MTTTTTTQEPSMTYADAPAHYTSAEAQAWEAGVTAALENRAPIIDADGFVWLFHQGGFRMWLDAQNRFSTAHIRETRQQVVAEFGERDAATL